MARIACSAALKWFLFVRSFLACLVVLGSAVFPASVASIAILARAYVAFYAVVAVVLPACGADERLPAGFSPRFPATAR